MNPVPVINPFANNNYMNPVINQFANNYTNLGKLLRQLQEKKYFLRQPL